jgi:hypothetical protein
VANAISAQKAEDGKIFWVEFTPQFYAHLVKCAVALVPRPLYKVKKVMFGYILDLLNGEGPQAFFDLTMGMWWATQAQKEKRRLAWKRNHILRHDHRIAAQAVADGPERYCEFCKQQFATRRSQKRHRCPLANEKSGVGGIDKGKGPALPQMKKNKPNPKTPTTTSDNLMPPATTNPQAQKKQAQKPTIKKKKTTAIEAHLTKHKSIPTPSGAREAATCHVIAHTMDGELASDQLYEKTEERHSARLNTQPKCKIRCGLMDTLRDK